MQPFSPQPYLQPQPPVLASAPASIPTSSLPTDPKADFFGRNSACAQGCAFCGHLGHHIHACPAAKEYVDTGHVKIINCHLYLLTGHPIPNDGCSLGLKAGVDTWLAANQQYSNTALVPTT